jgi:hypothetical protein
MIEDSVLTESLACGCRRRCGGAGLGLAAQLEAAAARGDTDKFFGHPLGHGNLSVTPKLVRDIETYR